MFITQKTAKIGARQVAVFCPHYADKEHDETELA
jgi:hypothetical protein